MKLPHLLVAAVIALSLVRSASAQLEGRVTIFVDASAQNVIKELGDKFTAEANIVVKSTPGPTQNLMVQLFKGTPTDLFLAGSAESEEKLKKEKMIAKSTPLWTNQLVLVVPKGNLANIASPEDLLTDKIKKVGLANDQTSAGKYTQQALTALKLYDALDTSKKVVRGADERATLGYVERGEVDAAIVYSTDGRSDKVSVVYTFDGASHDKIAYPLMLTPRGAKNSSAEKFYDFLLSKEANDICEKHGFARLEN